MTGKPRRTAPAKAMAHPGPPPPAHAGAPNHSLQAARTFAALPKPHTGARGGSIDELVPGTGGVFQTRDPERHVLSRPNGVYNFVRVQGATRNQSATYVSARAPHATLAGGRPVLYAGTASFQAGELAWWSNYSGTYQPNAEFNRQAALPPDRFVPWQKLQMGGIGLQRGMLTDARATRQPDTPAKPQAKAEPPGKTSDKTEATAPARQR